MYDLTAQVTSSLLPFSGVTLEALGEDEITLDSVPHGKFTVGRTGLAWLACGPHLEVVHAVTGERVSAYRFSGGGEHPPVVLAARDFSWLKRSGLLVGLEEAEGSVLCLYDLSLSRVVKAVLIPGRITAIEPLVSYGGASTSTQHLHQSLRWFFGIAAVVTDLGHVLLVDLCLDLSCSQSELEASDLQVVTKSPAEIPRLRKVSTREGRHLCLQVNAPTGVGVSALQYIPRTNQLAVGFSDGYLQLWNMKTLKKEYHSQLDGGRVPVFAFTFQEPENDPRNCCYLWAVQSSQDLDGDVVSLHLLQLAFSERKCLSSGKILYEGLEYCEERYSQDLSGTAFPVRVQATNTRLLNCLTIEKFRAHPDRDDSMNEVASPDTSVSMFSWQVRVYGQGTPTTYIAVFDINRWYHAQMPDSLRAGESLQNCPYLAVWSLDSVIQMVSQQVLMDVVVHERSLSRGLPFTCPPPEQYFNPTAYNFDATCLFNSGIVHLTCSGYQKETLTFLKKAGPCSSDIISTSYSHCLMSGLISSRLADIQPSSLSQEEQLNAILSTAVETSSMGLITGSIKQWIAEEEPGSALNLRYILDWAWNKVVQTKKDLDNICAPLFDCSSNFTDSQTLQLLQHSQRLLSNLSAIFHCLLSEGQELTQKGLDGLMNKNMVSSLISRYAQAVLWFCRTGLLPEGPDEDALQISRPFYTHSVISSYYIIQREELTRLAKGKWSADCLMIDGLIGQCGERLTNLWKRDEGGTGQYPPPSLHALLDIYLQEDIDEATKHAIVIYLLLDVMYSFPNKNGASVESFPTAFAIPIGLVKLVQGLWLLDHHDHQSSFELLLHPAASQCHFEWQHERILHALMCQNQQSVALRYFHVTKPPISSISQAKLCLAVLLHNRCLLEAWCLLRQHSNRLNMSELLGFMYQSCQELGLMKELLKLPLGLNEREGLEKFLQGTGGFQNRELLIVHYLQQANYISALQLNHTLNINMVNEKDPKFKERTIARNSIIDQYGKILPRVQRKLTMERAKPYQHRSTIHREVSRPKPLSTITKQSTNEKVISRAGFINNVLTKIEEVWLGKGPTPHYSPATRPHNQSPKHPSLVCPEPFLGTPVTERSKRMPRVMDLAVHRSDHSPQPVLSPPQSSSSCASPKITRKAPEFSLLKTPLIVKQARALAASLRVHSSFTPQSILRSSLRPTPVATPSASPRHSTTPPLSRKESRITFIDDTKSPETEKSITWTNGVAADSEISLLTRGATLSKATCKMWSSEPAEEEEEEGGEEEEPHLLKFLLAEGGTPSPQQMCSESESSSIHEVITESEPPVVYKEQIGLSFNTSQQSIPTADTTLEYFDATLSCEDLEDDAVTKKDDDVVTVNIKPFADEMEQEESLSLSIEQTVHQTSDDKEGEEEENEQAREEKMLEDVIAVALEQEEKIAEEQEADSQEEAKQEDGVEVSEIFDSVSEVNSKDLPMNAEDQEVKSKATEPRDIMEHPEPSEATEITNKPVGDLEQSTDLTEFVEQHLFGDDLLPPLTRSGIHNASHTQLSFNSECLVEDVEEQPEASEVPPLVIAKKTCASVTSSEAAGTDSHSVVSVNDSEELSSPTSDEEEEKEEEEEDEEEEEEEESDQAEEKDKEEEDSGSEVEIIEEVQGNGRLPLLLPSSVFMEPAHTHFLPALSEQEAAEFSIIPTEAQMKMVDEGMEGEVVMVQLGTDDGEIDPDDVEQESSYMELKPSTTLLVPFELMEGHHGLAGVQMDLPELQQADVIDNQPLDSESDFSLMLDLDVEGDKEEDTKLPIENVLLLSDPVALCQAVDACEEVLPSSQVILVSTEDSQGSHQSGDALQEDDKKEVENLEGNYVGAPRDSELVELPKDLQTAAHHETEDAPEQDTVELELLAEDNESITVSVSGRTLVEELQAAVNDTDAMEKTEICDAETAEIPETVDGDDNAEKSEIFVTFDDTKSEEKTEMVVVVDDADSLEKLEIADARDANNSGETAEIPETVDKKHNEEKLEILKTEETNSEEKTEISVDMDDADSLEKTEISDARDADNSGETAEIPETVNKKCNEEKLEILKTSEDINLEENTESTEVVAAVDDGDSLKKMSIPETVDHCDNVEKTEDKETVDDSEEMTEMPESVEDKDVVEKVEIQEAEDDTDSVEKTDAFNEIEESDKASTVEEQQGPAENGPVGRDAEVFATLETKPAVEEKQKEQEEKQQEEKQQLVDTASRKNSDKAGKIVMKKSGQDLDVDVLTSDKQVPDGATAQKKKLLSPPTWRITRSKKIENLISLIKEEADEQAPKEEIDMENDEATSLIPASLSRKRKKDKWVEETKVKRRTPKLLVQTTRRVSLDEAEETNDDIRTTTTSKATSPARRSQRAMSTRTRRSTRSSSKEQTSDVEAKDGEDREHDGTKVKAGRRTSSRISTLTKSRTATISTSRRTRSRTFSDIDKRPEIQVGEIKEDVVLEPTVKRSSRLTKTARPEVLRDLLEVEEQENTPIPSSSGRTTRQSNRISLDVYPQEELLPLSLPESIKKLTEEIEAGEGLLDPQLGKNTDQTNSTCQKRGKLWDHPEEDLPLLDSPLEVDSGIPVTDALIKQFQDEEEKQEVITKKVRTSRKKRRSPVDQGNVVPEPRDEDSSPVKHTLCSPPRRRARGSRAQSLDPSEEPTAAPVTRSYRATHSAQEGISSEDHIQEEETATVSKTRTSKRKAKSTAAEPFPIAVPILISPIPSPVDPPLQARVKRVKLANFLKSTSHLQRQRVIDSFCKKPVTRRK